MIAPWPREADTQASGGGTWPVGASWLRSSPLIRAIGSYQIRKAALDDVADDARYGLHTFITSTEKRPELEMHDQLRQLAEQ